MASLSEISHIIISPEGPGFRQEEGASTWIVSTCSTSWLRPHQQSQTAPTDQPGIAAPTTPGPNNAVATSATGLVFHNVTGTLANGSTFRGTLRITSLAPNPNDPTTVLASGTLTGIVRNATGGVTR